jgi:hypothetical protein
MHLPMTTDPDPRRGLVRISLVRWLSVLALLCNPTVQAQIVYWGNDCCGLNEVPPEAVDVVALAGGDSFLLGLRAGGRVLAWGTNTLGQLDVPAGLYDVVAIGSGDAPSLALNANGTVVAWGDDSAGQAAVPANLRDVVSLASSGQHVLALTRGGQVVAWGENYWGQSEVPLELDGVRAVVADLYTSLALKADGKVVGWGLGLFGQSQVLPLLENVSAIQAFAGCAVAFLGDAPPSTHLPLSNPGWNIGEFRFEFIAPRDSVYALEFTDSLAPLHWATPPLVRGDGTVHSWTDLPRSNQRFYRVRYW